MSWGGGRFGGLIQEMFVWGPGEFRAVQGGVERGDCSGAVESAGGVREGARSSVLVVKAAVWRGCWAVVVL